MNVHDHHSRFEARCKKDSFLAVEGFPDDTEVVIALDHFAQKLPNEWMVIDEENLYWLGMRRLAVFVEHGGARCQRLEEPFGNASGVARRLDSVEGASGPSAWRSL